MSRFLLYHRTTRPSGQRLAEWMGLDHGTELDEQEPRDFLVRWGSRAGIRRIPTNDTINRKRVLDRQANRYDQLRLLREAGVRTPPFGRDPYGFPQGSTILGRGEGGFGGRDIEVYEPGGEPIGEHPLYTQFIPKDREYRCHVIAGRVAKTQEKIPDEERMREQVVWNLDNGFTFRWREDIPQMVRTLALSAVGALELDFGAVDIIDPQDGRPMVLEVNTAPGLYDTTLETYGERLGRLIGLTPNQMPQWEAVEREGADG